MLTLNLGGISELCCQAVSCSIVILLCLGDENIAVYTVTMIFINTQKALFAILSHTAPSKEAVRKGEPVFLLVTLLGHVCYFRKKN